jgi:aspartate-semialdehyde dehydrogenase
VVGNFSRLTYDGILPRGKTIVPGRGPVLDLGPVTRRKIAVKSVAVVGASGAVGDVMIRLLQERKFPVGSIKFLASERSAGKSVTFAGATYPIEPLTPEAFAGVEIVLSSTPASISREFSPIAARAGAVVVDNSSAFRMDPDVPLVVPEVNPHEVARHKGIIANPNCSTIQMVVALQPLHAAFGLETVIVSTYQSVSGTGGKGVSALDHEVKTGKRHPDSPYPHPIAFNVLPHIDVFDGQGWSGEERKMIAETRKIMGLPALHVVPTTVRVPVRVGHSESIYARFSRPVTVEGARSVLESAPGVIVQDDPASTEYPLAIHVAGHDEVFVGRLRQDPDDDHALLLWVVGDNLRKGAATNAVQIGEIALAQTVSEVQEAHYV